MSVLVIGASGWIGGALVDGLQIAGHRVIVAGRDVATLRRRWPHLVARYVDLAALKGADGLSGLLDDVTCIVNAAGILVQSEGNEFAAVHTTGPLALYRACADAGIHRVVHLSALGADVSATEPFLASKHALDEAMLALPLSTWVLMPSLVFGPGGTSSQLFLRLAHLPLLPLPGRGAQAIQPVHLADLVATVIAVLRTDSDGRRLAVVGPRCLSVASYITLLRSGLGLRPPRIIDLPRSVIRTVSMVGRRVTWLQPQMLSMLERGNCSDVAPLSCILGREPRDASSFVAGTPGVARTAVLDAIHPVLRLSLAALWMGTAIVTCLYPIEHSLQLLARTGIVGAPALLTLHAAAALDFFLGAALLYQPLRRLAYAGQMLLMLAYTILISLFLSEYWLHPYGPILKNLPLLALTFFLYRLESSDGLSRP